MRKKNKFSTIRELSGSEDHELWLRIASQYSLIINNSVTAALINHDSRSVVNINEDSLIKRQDLFVKMVTSNSALKSFIFGIKIY